MPAALRYVERLMSAIHVTPLSPRHRFHLVLLLLGVTSFYVGTRFVTRPPERPVHPLTGRQIAVAVGQHRQPVLEEAKQLGWCQFTATRRRNDACSAS